MGDPERELDALLARTLDADFGDIPESVLERIVDLEALVALKRERQGLSGSYTTDYLNRYLFHSRRASLSPLSQQMLFSHFCRCPLLPLPLSPISLTHDAFSDVLYRI